MDRDLTPRERRTRLRSFDPTDAAFVLHLSECERCRGHAAKLLGLGEATEGADVMLHLTRGGYLLALSGEAQQNDLPVIELQKFLQALTLEQAAFIGHLLDCARCRQAVAKALKPPSPKN